MWNASPASIIPPMVVKPLPPPKKKKTWLPAIWELWDFLCSDGYLACKEKKKKKENTPNSPQTPPHPSNTPPLPSPPPFDGHNFPLLCVEIIQMSLKTFTKTSGYTLRSFITLQHPHNIPPPQKKKKPILVGSFLIYCSPPMRWWDVIKNSFSMIPCLPL